MYYYSIFLNIAGKKCVVIGGGNVAERRIKELIMWCTSSCLFKKN